MKLTVADVEHVALLARLELSTAEKERMASELSKILDHVDQLRQLDTEGITATTNALMRRDVMRPDEQRPGLSNAEALANAPQREDGCFVVPQIV
jgi:aspartyl-tRNA(Asn)/glutamyl-tRNA(Gln) amidotransferase subunit C